MIIAIDGPAGVGKSSIAKRIAEKLGFLYLNSGNLYRAVTWIMLDKGFTPEQTESILTEAEKSNFSLIDGQLYTGNTCIEDQLHTDRIDALVAPVSSDIQIREFVNKKLREIAENLNCIVEGRDISTIVFPDADIKVFLDANADVRAERRFNQGFSTLAKEEIKEKIIERDNIDKNKKYGKLKIAKDALYLDTSYLTIEQVCERVLYTFTDKLNQ